MFVEFDVEPVLPVVVPLEPVVEGVTAVATFGCAATFGTLFGTFSAWVSRRNPRSARRLRRRR